VPIRPDYSGPRVPDRAPSFKVSTRQLGMIVLFASLSVLFTASLIAYLITRFSADVWRTPAMPALPRGLLASTAALVALSYCIQKAVSAIRHNRHEALVKNLWQSLLFAAAFLAGQSMNWLYMQQAALAPGVRTLYPFTFFLLTGLHAAHILGGFVPLGIVLSRARRREYSSSNHEGVLLCAQYWHYLGVVWLVLLGALYLAT
jgi:cytochrome c oxidase subunit 3